MGKFAEALGVWELKTGNLDLQLRPKAGHYRKMRKIMVQSQNEEDQSKMFEGFGTLMKEIITSSISCTKDEEAELETFIELNMNDLLQEAIVAMRFAKAEDIEKKKKELQGDGSKKE